MVEPTNGYKTRYGSIWPTEEQAESIEKDEAEAAFIEEFVEKADRNQNRHSIISADIRKAGDIIVNNINLIKELIEKYEL